MGETPTYKQAVAHLRKLRDSNLFTVQPSGDKRTLASRGVGVTWDIWESCKVVIANAISERAEYAMPDSMKDEVLENARAFHRLANAGPELVEVLEEAATELADLQCHSYDEYLDGTALGKRIKSAISKAKGTVS